MGVNIDWSKVPPNTNWLAMDRNGLWWGYRIKPKRDRETWESGYRSRSTKDGDMKDSTLNWANGTPWYDTLTQRPGKQMEKCDLVPGYHIVRYRNRELDTVESYQHFVKGIGTRILSPTELNDDLTHKATSLLDIVAVYEIPATPIWSRKEPSQQLVRLGTKIDELKAQVAALENLAAEIKAEEDAR